MAGTYWSTEEAVVDLANALGKVEALKAESRRYGYSQPAWHTREVAQVVGRVRDAVRYLCSDESDDPRE